MQTERVVPRIVVKTSSESSPQNFLWPYCLNAGAIGLQRISNTFISEKRLELYLNSGRSPTRCGPKRIALCATCSRVDSSKILALPAQTEFLEG